jgi:hypothetical protein
MSGASSGGDHDFETAIASAARPLHHAARIAVGGAHLELVRHAQILEHFDAGLHQGQIRLRAEDNADDWLH